MLRSLYLHTVSIYYLPSITILSYLPLCEYYQQYGIILWIIYSIVPILDIFIPDDNFNPTPEQEKTLFKQLKWKFPVLIYILSEWIVLFWGIHYFLRTPMAFYQKILFIQTLGHIGAIGHLYSHEFFHKNTKIQKFFGTINMLKSLYMHFYSQHLYGHHKNVSTPLDPATARLNQSLPSFIYQAITGSFELTWKRESEWAAKQGNSLVYNRLIWCVLTEIAFTLSFWAFWSFEAMLVFLAQALVSSMFLEVINYIRHYGLMRKEIRPGVYEKVAPKHSWNAPQMLSNVFLLKLQRHSDHHANAYKPYQILSSYQGAPNYPCGYSVCIPLSVLVPLWFWIINPLVQNEKDERSPTEKEMIRATKRIHVFIFAQAAISTMIFLGV